MKKQGLENLTLAGHTEDKKTRGKQKAPLLDKFGRMYGRTSSTNIKRGRKRVNILIVRKGRRLWRTITAHR